MIRSYAGLCASDNDDAVQECGCDDDGCDSYGDGGRITDDGKSCGDFDNDNDSNGEATRGSNDDAGNGHGCLWTMMVVILIVI